MAYSETILRKDTYGYHHSAVEADGNHVHPPLAFPGSDRASRASRRDRPELLTEFSELGAIMVSSFLLLEFNVKITKRFHHGSAGANLHIWDDTLASLTHLWSNTRNQGHASALMREITAFADHSGLRLVLIAKPYDTPQRGALRTHELVDFYKKFGFEVDPGSQPVKMMTRLPREKNTG